MTVLITLTTYGSDTGPFFDLYSNIDGYVTAFEQGVAKADLIAGYTATTVPDFATTIRVQSTGECTNHVDIAVEPTTTTTTTTNAVAPILITVDNTSTDIVITAITINGNPITISTGSLPLATGNSLTATMSDALIGNTVPIAIEYTFSDITQNISVDLGTPICYGVTGGTPATYTRDIILSDLIAITANIGDCV